MLNEKNLNLTAQWSQIGTIVHYCFFGIFVKTVPKENWTTDESYIPSIEKQWEKNINHVFTLN